MAIKLAFQSHPAIDSFREELVQHPELYERLQQETKTFEEVIGEVAAHVGIILDGIYVQNEVADLLLLLTHKLRERRGIHLVSKSPIILPGQG